MTPSDTPAPHGADGDPTGLPATAASDSASADSPGADSPDAGAAAAEAVGASPSDATAVLAPVGAAGGGASAASDAKAKKQKKEAESGGGWRFLREVAIVLVCALVLSVLVRTFLVQAFYVPSQSMENTLMPNDRILASKITTQLSGVGRGEVVVFKDPGGWLAPVDNSKEGVLHKGLEFVGLLPSSSGDDLVKRVIGIAGDHVVCCNADKQIVLNGVGLVEPYIKPGSGTAQVPFDIVVPPESVFVMGDNRSQSADSRYHMTANNGGVPLDDIVGRVVLKVWPLDSFGTVPIPETFDNPALNNQSAGSAPPVPSASGKVG